jgi:uncharacterized protein YegP (UPF0339 family)
LIVISRTISNLGKGPIIKGLTKKRKGGNIVAAKFEIYKGKIGDFRWRLAHTNGQILANSGEGYTTKVNAINGIKSVKDNSPSAVVEDKTV